jgi:hypothetical protein
MKIIPKLNSVLNLKNVFLPIQGMLLEGPGLFVYEQAGLIKYRVFVTGGAEGVPVVGCTRVSACGVSVPLCS